jgi:hypothetical protein
VSARKGFSRLPHYLARHGTPTVPNDLEQHRIVGGPTGAPAAAAGGLGITSRTSAARAFADYLAETLANSSGH